MRPQSGRALLRVTPSWQPTALPGEAQDTPDNRLISGTPSAAPPPAMEGSVFPVPGAATELSVGVVDVGPRGPHLEWELNREKAETLWKGVSGGLSTFT